MTETPLDRAYSAIDAAPDDDSVRLRYYERLSDAELFLLLDHEPSDADDDQVEPQIFDVEGDRFVLVFDTAERLAEFAEGAAAFVSLSGRMLIKMLAKQSLGLGINMDVAPSAYLLDADGVAWLANTLDQRPDEEDARIVEVAPPGSLPEKLLTALDAKLALMGAAARGALLAQITLDSGARSHLLAFVDPAPGAESALSGAAHEALTFSGLEAGQLDVTFLRSSDEMADRMGKVALKFDLPDPVSLTQPAAPGSDPQKPPKLI